MDINLPIMPNPTGPLTLVSAVLLALMVNDAAADFREYDVIEATDPISLEQEGSRVQAQLWVFLNMYE